VFCVISRGLCDGLITGPEESYRLWYVVVFDHEASITERPWPTGGGADAPWGELLFAIGNWGEGGGGGGGTIRVLYGNNRGGTNCNDDRGLVWCSIVECYKVSE
jgi:hypothetical protein